jgi:hypothetical protein
MASTPKPLRIPRAKRQSTGCKVVTPRTGCHHKIPKDPTDPCYQHGQNCKSTYDQYHDVCTEIWDDTCSDDLNYHQNWRLAKDAENCANLRYKFMSDCVDNTCSKHSKWGNKHWGAIKKMRLKKGHCNQVLHEQGEDLQEGIREFLKEQAAKEKELLARYEDGLRQMEALIEQMRIRQAERRKLEESISKPATDDLLVLPIPLEPEEVSSTLNPEAGAFIPRSQRVVPT